MSRTSERHQLARICSWKQQNLKLDLRTIALDSLMEVIVKRNNYWGVMVVPFEIFEINDP